MDPFAAVATLLETTDETTPAHILLKLKPPRKRRVRFADDVVDNEDLCRKKSKNCCVFHRSMQLPDGDEEDVDQDEDRNDESTSKRPASAGGSSDSVDSGSGSSSSSSYNATSPS